MGIDHWIVLLSTSILVGYTPTQREPLALAFLGAAILLGISLDLHLIFAELR